MIIAECGAAVAIIEGIKSGVGGIVKRFAAKKDRKEEKAEKKVDEHLRDIDRAIVQMDEQIKGISSSLELQKETSKFILYDRLRYLAKCFISDGLISFEDRDTWNSMADCYHKNGGNGTINPLAEAVNSIFKTFI